MKQVKDIFGRFITSLLSGILGVLGFSSCSNEGNEPELMYGTPTGSFEVKGAVTDRDGNPISGVYIINRRGSSRSGGYSLPGDTAETDANGSYTLNSKDFNAASLKLVCDPNGNEYEADSTNVALNYTGGDGKWNIGHAVTSQNFTLRKKTTD